MDHYEKVGKNIPVRYAGRLSRANRDQYVVGVCEGVKWEREREREREREGVGVRE